MKRGLFLTLMTVTFACLYGSQVMAEAPTVQDPGDVIIGNAENADDASAGDYVFPSAFSLDSIVSDNATADADIKWSYSTDSPGTISVNGAEELDPVGMVLNDNDPTSPRNAARIDRTNDVADLLASAASDTYFAAGQSDDDNDTITIRRLDLAAGDGASSPTGLLDGDGQPVSLTLYASDCETYTARTITVYTSNNTSDTLTNQFGLATKVSSHFGDDGQGVWLSRNLFGFGGTNAHAATGAGVGGDPALIGLCSTVSTTGDNATQWNSPDEFVELTAFTAYRVRMTMATDQAAANAQPLWFSIVANAHFATHPTDPGFISFGSQRHRLDNTGGASGILDSSGTRTIGLNQFDHWVVPNAVLTDQWNGNVPGVPGAFDVAAGSVKDMRLMFRIIDGGPSGPSLNTDLDAGTVCLVAIEVTCVPIADLINLETPGSGLDAALDGTTEDNGFAALASSRTADFGTTEANAFSLTVTAEDQGANTDTGGTSIRYDGDADGVPEANLQLRRYPLVWNDDELLIQRMNIGSRVVGGSETGGEGAAPIDFVNLTWSVPTNEIGGFDFTGRGAVGGKHDRAASPALPANTGGNDQEYISLFYTHRATVDATITDSNRVRGGGQFFGRADIGVGVAGDPLAVTNWEINRVALPPGDEPI